MRIVMVVASGVSYLLNEAVARAQYQHAEKMNYEHPLTRLVWMTSVISIVLTYLASYVLIPDLGDGTIWWKLSSVITCGTLAGAVIPELVKVFTSTDSAHVRDVVTSSREGGASLNILSGFVAGNFSAYWLGMAIMILMAVAYGISTTGLSGVLPMAPAVFAFGLVAFGFLGMGPVTIAVDSYGPVTDNAQSVYELSMIEQIPNIKAELKKTHGFDIDFERGEAQPRGERRRRQHLQGDRQARAHRHGGGRRHDDDLFNHHPADRRAEAGAGDQSLAVAPAISARADYRRRDDLLVHRRVHAGGHDWRVPGRGIHQGEHPSRGRDEASVEDSKKVVEICTRYAQKGMFNIFLAVFFGTLAFAFVEPFFFIGYLVSIALFGLYQAIFMANAGGAWDNAKKVVEVELKEKGTALHDATVVGDTVGDPFKDTSSVAMNPVIKFTTLFGLLAVDLAVSMAAQSGPAVTYLLSAAFFAVSVFFVRRSFYGMRIGGR